MTTDPRLQPSPRSSMRPDLPARVPASRGRRTGGTAVGLDVLKSMASAQAKPKLRVWLFKSFVTAGNDVLAEHVEAWAKERNVDVEMDWATFGTGAEVRRRDRGREPPDLAR